MSELATDAATNATDVITDRAGQTIPGDGPVTSVPGPTPSGGSRKRKRGDDKSGKKGKQGTSWTDDEELSFLEARYSTFLDAQAKKTISSFQREVINEWWATFAEPEPGPDTYVPDGKHNPLIHVPDAEALAKFILQREKVRLLPLYSLSPANLIYYSKSGAGSTTTRGPRTRLPAKAPSSLISTDAVAASLPTSKHSANSTTRKKSRPFSSPSSQLSTSVPRKERSARWRNRSGSPSAF
jgi:hypothetical protein